MGAQQSLAHVGVTQLGSEEFGVDPALPQICVLNAFFTQFLHHGAGGAEVEKRLVVGGFEQFPQQGLQHPHPVVLEVFRQVGVVTGHQGNLLGFGQPDASKPQHRGIHHMNEVRLEAVDGIGHSGPRQGQLELRIEG